MQKFLEIIDEMDEEELILLGERQMKSIDLTYRKYDTKANKWIIKNAPQIWFSYLDDYDQMNIIREQMESEDVNYIEKFFGKSLNHQKYT